MRSQTRLKLFWFFASLCLGVSACTGDQASPTAVPPFRRDFAPLPANAVTLDFEDTNLNSMHPWDPFYRFFKGRTSVEIRWFSMVWNGAFPYPTADGSFSLSSYFHPEDGSFYQKYTISFFPFVQQVRVKGRLSGNPGDYIRMVCHASQNGATYTSNTITSRDAFETLDVQGANIAWCEFDLTTGHAPGIYLGVYIDDVSFVPQTNQQPRVALSCAPTTTLARGDSISCTAQVTPAALQDSLKVSEWTFEGHPRTDGDVSSHQWGGVMVTAGMIRVKGTVQGTAVQDSTRISVTARPWPRMQAVIPAQDSLSGDLPATPTPMPPTATHPFGYDLGTLGHSRMQRVNMPYVGHADSILSGPNTGWSYVKTPLVGPYWSVNISAAFDHSSAWYQQQHYGSPGGPAGLPYCTKPQIDTLRMRAELHEGLRQTPLSPSDIFQPANNHYKFFRDWISTHDPNNKIFEPLVWNADSLTARVATSADQYMTQIWTEMVEGPEHTANEAAIDHVAVNLVPITCRAR